MDMVIRPRRLRKTETLRKMVRETRVSASSLIYPMFVIDGEGIEEEIPSMEGQYRYSVDRMPYALEKLVQAGVSNVMLSGTPAHKDECGSQAYAEDGIVQRALREAKRHPRVSMDELSGLGAEREDLGVLEALMALPEKFRLVLTLHYVEGYSTAEIAAMIGRTPSAVKMRLKKGGALVENELGKERE